MTRTISTVVFAEDGGVVQNIEVPTPFEVVEAVIALRIGGVDNITLYVLHDTTASMELVRFRLVPTFAPISDGEVHVTSLTRSTIVPMFGYLPGVLHLFRARTVLEARGDA